MRVVDAGVIVSLIVGRLDPDLLGDDPPAVPHLLDSEVTNALRRLLLRGDLSAQQAGTAMQGFLALTLTRFAADWLCPRMWELRHNLTAYDATYVALAELTRAEALLTTDARLAGAAGIRCPVVVLPS